MLLRAALLLAANVSLAGAQPSAAACCFAGGEVTYARMPDCEPSPGQRGVSEWLDLEACWQGVEAHFGNRTRQPHDGQNATIAASHPIFIIVLASGAAIAAPPGELLSLDSSVLPPGAVPVDGPMRGFNIVFSSPGDEASNICQPASVTDLQLAITDAQHLQPLPLNVQFAGCGRETHHLRRLVLTAIGATRPLHFSPLQTHPS